MSKILSLQKMTVDTTGPENFIRTDSRPPTCGVGGSVGSTACRK